MQHVPHEDIVKLGYIIIIIFYKHGWVIHTRSKPIHTFHKMSSTTHPYLHFI